MEEIKRDISALTIALNTNDAGTIHTIIEKFQDNRQYPEEQLRNLGNILLQDKDIFFALKKSLTLTGAGAKDDDVCQWLYNWYQIDTPNTRQFVLQFLPLLLWSYLYALSQNENLPGIEACLLCIYNHEVVARNGQDLTFTPPSLSVPSYLHHNPFTGHFSDPSAGNSLVVSESGGNSTLTENALRQFNKQAKMLVTDKRIEPLEVVTGGSRPTILKVVLKKYNSSISYMPNASLQEFCKMCKRLVGCGFDFSRITPALRHSKAFADKYIDDIPEPAIHAHMDYNSDNDSSGSEDEDEEIKVLLNGDMQMERVNSTTITTTTTTSTATATTTTTATATTTTTEKGKVKMQLPTRKQSSNKLTETKAAMFAKKPRIPLSATVLQELVSGLTFCVFRSETHKRAVHACTHLHLRACHDLIPEVILSVNALLQLDVKEKKEPSNINNNNNNSSSSYNNNNKPVVTFP